MAGFFKGVRRFFGQTGKVLRQVGSFAVKQHQPISMLLHGLGEATGNSAMKNIGNLAMIGSAAATAGGHGIDYLGGIRGGVM